MASESSSTRDRIGAKHRCPADAKSFAKRHHQQFWFYLLQPAAATPLFPDNARAVGVLLTINQPSCCCVTCWISSSGALSLSMLNTPSVTTSCGPWTGGSKQSRQMK
ncbi:hypothetical protein ACLK1Z_04655 [Escherichia coli]